MAEKKLTEASRTLHQQSARILTDWTPAKLKSAWLAAENGNLSHAVALCEWLLTDERVAAALDARVDALLGLAPSFEPGTGRRSARAVRALEAGEDWWDSYQESELRSILKWGILLGLAPGRHEWQARPDHGNRVLPGLTFWNPQSLRWDWTLRRWTIRDSSHVEYELVPGDGEWVLHTPGGRVRPWKDGVWLSLGRWVLLKQYAMGDWGRHSEKGSLLVATAPDGASQQQRQELASDLASAGSDTAVALANGFDLKLVEVAANTVQIYNAQINAADDAIAIRIRGGNLSTEVNGGSLAAAQSQAKTNETPKLKADAQGLTTTLHDQSLVWWAEFNFGDRRLAPWPVYPVEPEEDKAAKATMVKTLGEGVAVWDKLGFEVDPNELVEQFGLSFLTGKRKEPEPAPEPVAGQPPSDQGAPQQRAYRPVMAAQDGFRSGQLYVDDLVDSAGDAAGKSKPLRGFIADLLEVVEGAEDYDSLRTAVLRRYRDEASPVELRDILHKALVLAELAGYAAVRQDVPELAEAPRATAKAQPIEINLSLNQEAAKPKRTRIVRQADGSLISEPVDE